MITNTPPPHIIEFAIERANKSVCQSKRGAAVFDGENLVSLGCNGIPKPYICDSSDNCKRSCYRTAIHAEAAAISGVNVRGFEMMHVKTVNGKLVSSMGPSCL